MRRETKAAKNLWKQGKDMAAQGQNLMNQARKGNVAGAYKSAKGMANDGRKLYTGGRRFANRNVRNGKAARNAVRRQVNNAKKTIMTSKDPVKVGLDVMRQQLMLAKKNANEMAALTGVKGNGTPFMQKELLVQVYGGGDTFAAYNIPVSPSVTSFGPLAANLSRQFQKVFVNRITISYETRASMETSGKVWMGFSSQTDQFSMDAFQNGNAFAALTNKPTGGGTSAHTPTAFDIHIHNFGKGSDRTLTNFNGNVNGLSNNKEQYIGGYFVYAIDNITDTSQVGEIWVTYEYIFLEACVPNPQSDFYNGIDLGLETAELGSVLSLVGNSSNQPVTQLAKMGNDIYPSVVAPIRITCWVTLRMSGTGFPTSALVLDAALSNGSSKATYTTFLGSTTEQLVEWYMELLPGGWFNFTANGTSGIVLQTFQLQIALSTVNITTATPPANPPSIQTLNYPNHIVASAFSQFKITGKPSKLMHIDAKPAITYYFIDDGMQEAGEEQKYPELEECHETLTQCSEPPKNQLRGWVDQNLTHVGMHARNGNGLYCLFLLLILIVESQRPPISTTTRHPTVLPTTRFPTKRPTTKLPTTTPPPTTRNPTIAPTDALNHYSLIQAQGLAGSLFSTYVDLSTKPIVTKINGNTLRHNGINGYDKPLIICSTYTDDEQLIIGNVWAEPWNGTFGIAGGMTTTCVYGLAAAGDRDITFTKPPTMSPVTTLNSVTYVGTIEEIPDFPYFYPVEIYY